ncbi:bifunctional helix-turn-helix transcriptional regulator/GNAT family N-acetyltransferase [Chryseobacterium sp. SSA4.19]|uniref:bifunctional helix-turn-helix transcriptional regulator/GNAT family N-acetyltransferase n=1 Tax=Chryseobacterium sp. SSA4.19 TaxID=2919915 RepID=UPI001F4D5527|nr:bifunctional helix-turn-helix transcriptional regulator/GNAT family N-acetyltransferase [Chryseobacterium sp. SSA4.19]MCJ8152770.1 bifunctional helix-turn-helix transcriptional regulator/GNAT family N-acetyltransferase [Chryseobacterium sp. SSA4.19]
MSFFDKTGKMALGSRLRLLTAKVTENAAKIYELYDIDFSPKWFPVFFIVSETGPITITQIAEQIGHSQPSVTKIIKEMTKTGLIENYLASEDKRRNTVGLTKKGAVIAERMIREQCVDIENAIDKIMDETTHNLWEAIAEWEALLEQKSLYERVRQQKKFRESKRVQIVDYSPDYQSAFRSLNEEWISKYFEMEKTDYKALDHPDEYILNRGKIFVALYNNEPLGVCALIKMDDPEYDFEMAKMAVSPKAQGKNIGYLLGLKVIHAAKELGAKKIYLESNTVLKPAVNLYHKLGFQKISGRFTPYQRCNIQMGLTLKD